MTQPVRHHHAWGPSQGPIGGPARADKSLDREGVGAAGPSHRSALRHGEFSFCGPSPARFSFALVCFIIECDTQEGMGDRGEDMRQRTAGRNRTRVAAVRYALLRSFVS